MKQLATIGTVVALLLMAALFYGKQDTSTPPVIKNATTTPVVDVVETPTSGIPITTAALDGTLSLKAGLSNSYLLHGQNNELYASFDTRAIKHEGSARPPINIALVIDRSGSMSGEKFENVKSAARRLATLVDSRDRIALVSYGSDVSVDFPSSMMTEENRARLLSAINRLVEGGGTNISGGFQAGYSEVSRWKNTDSVDRVILMSDGHANVGMTSERELTNLTATSLAAGVSVTSIGVGLDYNEDLMKSMGNAGAGNYYFIDSAPSIVSIFEQEMKGLMSTVARNAVLVIKLAPGVEVAGVYGLTHRQEQNQIFVSMSEFRSEETKSLLMKLNVSGLKEKGNAPILNVSLSYEDTIHSKPVSGQLQLASVLTEDTLLLTQGVDVEVISRVQQVEVAKTLEEAMDLYSKGQAQEATKRIETTQRNMRVMRSTYKPKGGASYDRVERELDSVIEGIQSAAPSSESGRTMIKSQKARGNDIVNSAAKF